jgi:hypothetical protein
LRETVLITSPRRIASSSHNHYWTVTTGTTTDLISRARMQCGASRASPPPRTFLASSRAHRRLRSTRSRPSTGDLRAASMLLRRKPCCADPDRGLQTSRSLLFFLRSGRSESRRFRSAISLRHPTARKIRPMTMGANINASATAFIAKPCEDRSASGVVRGTMLR